MDDKTLKLDGSEPGFFGELLRETEAGGEALLLHPVRHLRRFLPYRPRLGGHPPPAGAPAAAGA